MTPRPEAAIPAGRMRGSPGFWTTWQLWRQVATDRPEALANLALRTRSPLAMDALALAATDGHLDSEHLLKASSDGGVPALRDRTVPALAALALVWAARGRDEEVSAAAQLYGRLWQAGHGPRLAARHHLATGQALFLAGRLDQLRAVVEELHVQREVRHYLRTDLAHPYRRPGVGLAPQTPAHQQWEEALSGVFTDAGLAALQVRPRPWQPASLFDHLVTEPAPSGASGPLVTVVMPCYRPDAGLLTSIASIGAQTWTEIEIILVDDASGPEYEPLIDRALAMDARARLLRLDRNAGSYVARNAALAEARGEFITFQDADDWSHPQRIELQLAPLLADDARPASRSRAVRATEQLTHQWFGYRAVRDNASSLMLRREVLDRLGPFAAVRKGADSEYAERVATMAGPIADTGTPLAVTRLRAGSLSRGDFTYQWAAPDRLTFRGSYRAWHRALAAGRTDAKQPHGAPVPYPVPVTFRRGLAGAKEHTHLRVAYLADFSHPPDTAVLAQLLEHLAEHPDDVVGLWHGEAPDAHTPARPEMHEAWYDAMVTESRLRPVSRVEPLHVERLVVLDPRVLLVAGNQPCAVTVGGAEVHLAPEHVEPDASGLPLDLLSVADACWSLWRCRPRWLSAEHLGPAQREQLRRELPHLLGQ